MHGRCRIYVSITKERMKSGEALVGMKRSGSQLLQQVVSQISNLIDIDGRRRVRL